MVARHRHVSRATALAWDRMSEMGRGGPRCHSQTGPQGSGRSVLSRLPRPSPGPFTHTPLPTRQRSSFPPRAVLAKKSNQLFGRPPASPVPQTSVMALGCT